MVPLDERAAGICKPPAQGGIAEQAHDLRGECVVVIRSKKRVCARWIERARGQRICNDRRAARECFENFVLYTSAIDERHRRYRRAAQMRRQVIDCAGHSHTCVLIREHTHIRRRVAAHNL